MDIVLNFVCFSLNNNIQAIKKSTKTLKKRNQLPTNLQMCDYVNYTQQAIKV